MRERHATLVSPAAPSPNRLCPASAGVYDVEGRLLRTLWRGERLPAGRQNPQWNGADDQGQPLPPGRY